jgi:4-alpha-glucanotransferase
VGGYGSPYSPHSLFAGNPLVLSPEILVERGFLGALPDPGPRTANGRAVDFPSALAFKERLVDAAFEYSHARVEGDGNYEAFRSKNSPWLEDYSLYYAISKEQGRPWYEWPEGIRRREPSALEEKRALLEESVERVTFAQYLFESQWSELLGYARSRGVRVLGDVPFYVLHDSVDIWTHMTFFKVDQDGTPSQVAGVPPDYFSKTGQRWGNPVYDWDALKRTGYAWWKDRLTRSLELADRVRLDHFRGYVAYWEIPAEETTAVRGRWVRVPGDFLDSVRDSFPELPFVAEDLGEITQDVKDAIAFLGIPGMRVLEFAFDGTPDNDHLPSNHPRNCYVYTGTHDTNTIRGWFTDEATPGMKSAIGRYLGHEVTVETVSREFVSMALGSVADVSVIPMQDLLDLGSEARMNNPATTSGNWRWRVTPAELSENSFMTLKEQTVSNGRG